MKLTTKPSRPNHDHRLVYADGRMIGFRGLGTDVSIRLTRCPECHRENYAPAVQSGTCAWCGFDANAVDDEVISS